MYDFELLQQGPCGHTQAMVNLGGLQMSSRLQRSGSSLSNYDLVVTQAASTSFDATHRIPEGVCWDTVDAELGKWGRTWDARWRLHVGYTLSEIVKRWG